ncbi:hypothetical protein [Streptomyces sp. NPDC002889]|uniref:hypothetical protein n=1 Tax=Streptomyces sp. NPDC002889 TaxID=3364669 RepID=UPI00367FDE91
MTPAVPGARSELRECGAGVLRTERGAEQAQGVPARQTKFPLGHLLDGEVSAVFCDGHHGPGAGARAVQGVSAQVGGMSCDA